MHRLEIVPMDVIASECVRILSNTPHPELSRDVFKCRLFPEASCFSLGPDFGVLLNWWYDGVNDRMVMSIYVKELSENIVGVDFLFSSMDRCLPLDEILSRYLLPHMAAISSRLPTKQIAIV